MKENRITKYTGGSRIGSRNLTIPFASLNIEKEKIELKSTGFKTLIFRPENLVDIGYLGSNCASDFGRLVPGISV